MDKIATVHVNCWGTIHKATGPGTEIEVKLSCPFLPSSGSSLSLCSWSLLPASLNILVSVTLKVTSEIAGELQTKGAERTLPCLNLSTNQRENMLLFWNRRKVHREKKAVEGRKASTERPF